MGRLQPFTGNIKVSGTPKGVFALNPIHEETSIVETEADSRGCWQGLRMQGNWREKSFHRHNSLGREEVCGELWFLRSAFC